MLVLSRDVEQALCVGETIVTVARINGDEVTLAVGDQTHVLKKNDHFKIEEEDSTVVIVEVRKIGDKNKVRLGVEAPNEVPVHRKEVYDAIIRNNESIRIAEEKRNAGS